MPVFGDRTNVPEILPEGDYIFTVTKFEVGISRGKSTSGSDLYELTLSIEPTGKTVREKLIDHESCAWKLDCFLKCCGIKIAKGERYEFRQDLAAANECRWINPEGFRGWCHVIQEEFLGKDNKPRKGNKVSVFYTDRPKLEPVAAVEGEEDDKF